MKARDGDISLTRHAADSAGALLDNLCDVYSDAYGVASQGEKTIAFRNRAMKGMSRPNFELAVARSDNELVGFAFGYSLSSDDTYWWEGLRPKPSREFVIESGRRTFVLAEIEVLRSRQGMGVGRLLHDDLLKGRHEERATLASNPSASSTHAVYENWGWQRAGQVPGSSGDYFDAYDLFVLPLR